MASLKRPRDDDGDDDDGPAIDDKRQRPISDPEPTAETLKLLLMSGETFNVPAEAAEAVKKHCVTLGTLIEDVGQDEISDGIPIPVPHCTMEQLEGIVKLCAQYKDDDPWLDRYDYVKQFPEEEGAKAIRDRHKDDDDLARDETLLLAGETSTAANIVSLLNLANYLGNNLAITRLNALYAHRLVVNKSHAYALAKQGCTETLTPENRQRVYSYLPQLNPNPEAEN